MRFHTTAVVRLALIGVFGRFDEPYSTMTPSGDFLVLSVSEIATMSAIGPSKQRLEG